MLVGEGTLAHSIRAHHLQTPRDIVVLTDGLVPDDIRRSLESAGCRFVEVPLEFSGSSACSFAFKTLFTILC